MHKRIIFRLPALFAIAGLMFMAYANIVSAAIQGTVTIEQTVPKPPYGTWTLISADKITRSSSDEGANPKSYSFTVQEVGATTLSVTPPAGSSARISVYRNGDLVRHVEGQQYSFTIYPNDSFRFVIQYSLVNMGSLGINSDPSKILFRLQGPDGKRYSGRTPKTFYNLPIGRYTIRMSKVDGCYLPRPQNVQVSTGTRQTVNVSISCEKPDDENTVSRERPSLRMLRQNVLDREQKYR